MKKLLPVIAVISVLSLTQCGKQSSSRPQDDDVMSHETAGYTHERMKELEGYVPARIEVIEVEEMTLPEELIEEIEGYHLDR